jgi:hypothetical protein
MGGMNANKKTDRAKQKEKDKLNENKGERQICCMLMM